jgi:hypothetical protein
MALLLPSKQIKQEERGKMGPRWRGGRGGVHRVPPLDDLTRPHFKLFNCL